jgi:hypothetical protein
VHRVSGLEADDAAPALLLEVLARLRRVHVPRREVGRGPAEDGDGAADERAALGVDGRDAGMRVLARAEDELGLALAVDHVAVLDLHDREQRPVGALERDPARGRLALGDRERHRQRPGQAVLEVHVLDDARVVTLDHEAGERRERARGDHVEVGGLLLGHAHAGKAGGLALEPGRLLAGDGAVDELAAMRRDHEAALGGGVGCAHATASSSSASR